MSPRYSEAFRDSALDDVVAELRSGHSEGAAVSKVAAQLGVSVTTLRRWRKSRDSADPSLAPVARVRDNDVPTRDMASPLVPDAPSASMAPEARGIGSPADRDAKAARRRVLIEEATGKRSDGWWRRNRDLITTQAIAGLVTGLVVTGAGIAVTNYLTAELAAAQAQVQADEEASARILENIRFVREITLNRDQERPFTDLDLRGASLGLDFRCAEPEAYKPEMRICLDFSGSNLSGSILNGADLSEALLLRTQLSGTLMVAGTMDRVLAPEADFSRAIITKSSLTQSSFSGANFREAELHTSDLRQSTFGCGLTQCVDLTGATLWGSDLRGVDFSGATLRGADLGSTCFDETTIWPEDLEGVEIPDEPTDRYCLSSPLPTAKPWYRQSASDVASSD